MNVLRMVGVTVAMGFGFGTATVPALGQAATQKPPVVSHDLEGRSQCLMCHTAGVMEAVPDAPKDHEGRTNETCMLCHAKESPLHSGSPPVITHELEGRAKCLMCHTAGVMEAVPDVPASHKAIGEQHCGLCHQPAEKKTN